MSDSPKKVPIGRTEFLTLLPLFLLTFVVGCGGKTEVSKLPDLEELPSIDALDSATQGAFDDVLAELEAAQKKKPADLKQLANAYIAIGKLAFAYGEFDLCRISFDNALVCDSSSFIANYGKGHVYRQQKEYEKAIESFEKSRDQLNDDLVIRGKYLIPLSLVLGDLYLEANKTDEAEASFEQALEKDRSSNYGRFGIARVYLAKDKPKKAISYLREVIQYEPKASNVRVEFARALEATGRASEAKKYKEAGTGAPLLLADPFLESISSLGNSLAAVKRRGDQALELDKDYEAAITHFRKANELAPNDVEVLTKLGSAYSSYGQKSEATKYLLEALKSDAQNARAHLELGRIYRDAKNNKKAMSHFEAAYSLEPRNYYYAMDYAYALLVEKELTKAISILESVAVQFPTGEQAQQELARAYTRAKQFDKARAHLERALVDLPHSITLKLMLVQILTASPDDTVRDGAKAQRILESVAANDSTVSYAQCKALVHGELGQFTQAEEWIDKAIKLAEEKSKMELPLLNQVREAIKKNKAPRLWEK